jgi:hypothetical protein
MSYSRLLFHINFHMHGLILNSSKCFWQDQPDKILFQCPFNISFNALSILPCFICYFLYPNSELCARVIAPYYPLLTSVWVIGQLESPTDIQSLGSDLFTFTFLVLMSQLSELKLIEPQITWVSDWVIVQLNSLIIQN